MNALLFLYMGMNVTEDLASKDSELVAQLVRDTQLRLIH